MKRTLTLVACLLVAATAAWAEGPAASAGACMLPDLTGLSPDQAAAAALEAGFSLEVRKAAAAPLCPITFRCTSILNCTASLQCSQTELGPCCTVPSGITLCCTEGTIWVKQCPCRCTPTNPCSTECTNSTDVTKLCQSDA